MEYIRYLTAGRRKVYLIYNGYQPHISVRSLYALLAHTPAKTQPCDVVSFGFYKRALNSLTDAVRNVDDKFVFDNWADGELMFEAYK